MLATVESTYQNVRLEYDVPVAAAALTISRTGPSGTAAAVRGWSETPVVPGSKVTARDYEAPIGVPLTYTATSQDTGGADIDAQIATVTVASRGCSDTWLNDLARVGNTLQV